MNAKEAKEIRDRYTSLEAGSAVQDSAVLYGVLTAIVAHAADGCTEADFRWGRIEHYGERLTHGWRERLRRSLRKLGYTLQDFREEDDPYVIRYLRIDWSNPK